MALDGTHLIDSVLETLQPVVTRLLVLRQVDGVGVVVNDVTQQGAANERLGEAIQLQHVKLTSHSDVTSQREDAWAMVLTPCIRVYMSGAWEAKNEKYAEMQ